MPSEGILTKPLRLTGRVMTISAGVCGDDGDPTPPNTDNLITANLAPGCTKQEQGYLDTSVSKPGDRRGGVDSDEKSTPRTTLVRSNDGGSGKADSEQDQSHKGRTGGEPIAAAEEKTLQTRSQACLRSGAHLRPGETRATGRCLSINRL